MSTKTRRNSWRGARKAHKVASHIGWAYRRGRKHGPKSVARYLAAAGITRGGLQKYRKARKTPMKYLTKKRRHKARRFRGVLANSGRRVGRYASFVRSFSHRHRGLSGPQLMKAAGRAWRGGARKNVLPPSGEVLYNRPKRRRSKSRSRRGSRSNPVLPYAAFNRPRRRKHRANPRRRSARRNPVLPYAAFNPGSAVASVKSGLKETLSVDYWTSTVLPLGAGFLFSQFAGGMVYSLTQKVVGTQTGIAGSLQRIGSRALGAVAVAAAATFLPIGKSRGGKGGMAAKVLAGGLVATLVSIVQEVFGMDTYSKITGMSDFGDMAADLTEELKTKIADSVRNEISRAENAAPGGVSSFVSTQNLRTAPDLGPGPRIGEMGSFVDTQSLATAPVAQQGPPVVADLSAFSDSFADMMLV